MPTDARAIVDTGFLVALCDLNDGLHQWAIRQVQSLPGPWLTCEACITELDHLLDFLHPPRAFWIYELLAKRVIHSQHLLPEQLVDIRAEISRYRDRRVDFADACLLVLSDQYPKLPVVTVDASDFAVYFRMRSVRKLITPPVR